MSKLKKSTLFLNAYYSLNPQQKKAVDTIEGPVIVIAGPGTGKTQTLSLRIANILLSTDVGPDAILALTFTDAAATAMRTRLANFIGETAYQVNIHTFHSFALEIIRTYPDIFSQLKAEEPISDLARYKLFQEILDTHSFKLLRPANKPHLYLPSLDSAIQNLKQEAITPSTFAQLLSLEEQLLFSQKNTLSKTEYHQRLKNLNKNKELYLFYTLYEQQLVALGKFDFADIINLVQQTLSQNKELLLSLQERFLYFLVDEYQDTNASQNKLLFTLTDYWKEAANLFVVGDPDQAIYRFQGASIENILDFTHRYPSAKIITLKTSYRSPQPLLDVAHTLISHNTFTTEKIGLSSSTALRAIDSSSSKQTIQVIHTPTSATETIFIVQKIKELLQQGISPSQIAIIYKHNSDSENLIHLLDKEQLAYKLQGRINILEDPYLIQLMQLLRTIYEIQTTSTPLTLFNILHYPFFALPTYDLTLITRHASEQNQSILDIITHQTTLQNIKVDTPDKLLTFAHKLLSWVQISKTETLLTLIEKVITESGFLKYILTKPNAYHILSKLNHFFSLAKTFTKENPTLSLDQFLQDLDFMQENHLSLDIPSEGFAKNAITLTTAHSAKGLEWDYVFLYRFVDKKWGNPRKPTLIKLPSSILSYTDISKKEKNEDERRLFYVALTRSRKQVFITYADEYQTTLRSTKASPSMFLYELPDNLYASKNLSFTQETLTQSLLSTLTPSSLHSKEKDFLTTKLASFALSPTALNNYLTCPYKFKLTNLLRVPKVKEPYLALGTAVHSALEDFYRQLNLTLVPPKKTFLLSRFKHHLDKELLTPVEKQKREEEGIDLLSQYYHLHKDSFKPALFTEKKLTVYLKDIKLTGKVDRIDLLSEQKKLVRIIDYKTGRPRTKNYIEGKTKDSKGELKRQLVFYQLLFSLYHPFHFKVKEVALDFISSAKEGRVDIKTFTISDDELNDLKQLIVTTMQKIKHLEFPKTTDITSCQTCPFRFHCWPEGLSQQ